MTKGKLSAIFTNSCTVVNEKNEATKLFGIKAENTFLAFTPTISNLLQPSLVVVFTVLKGTRDKDEETKR